MKRIILNILALITVMILIAGITACGEGRHDKSLEEIYRHIPDSLDRTRDLLKAIDRNKLSASDRHFYDFLSLKIDDKNYVRHTSDSLYLSIKNYYSHHADEDLYPEVLYYGGRVYSDLGDYPTALKYFQDALDALPEDTDNLDLKSCILSQTGRLLVQLCLYTEAEDYIKQTIIINRHMKDRVNLVYNLELLGIINFNLNNLSIAKKYFQEALDNSECLPSSFTAKTQMYLARTENKLGNYEEAMTLIRQTLDKVRPIARDWAIAYAAEIYYAAGVFDTAYIYARKIIDNPRSLTKKTGYKILLTSELSKYIPMDSLIFYVSKYNECIDEYLDKSDASQITLQVSLYNYNKKELAIQNAETSKSRLIVLGGSIILILTICLVILYMFRINNKRHTLEFQLALDKINTLYSNINDTKGEKNNFYVKKSQSEGTRVISDRAIECNTKDDVSIVMDKRSELKNSLMELYAHTSSHSFILPSGLLSSDAYLNLYEYINNKKIIPNESPLWFELEKELINYYPDFRKHLSILMNGKETPQDLQTCILIKLQLLPSVISRLLGISPGGLVSRRDSISLKIFQTKLGAKMTDSIIRLL